MSPRTLVHRVLLSAFRRRPFTISNKRPSLSLESLEDRTVLTAPTTWTVHAIGTGLAVQPDTLADPTPTPVLAATSTWNDYTILNYYFQNLVADGDTIVLDGTFDWTGGTGATAGAKLANASWALGSDGLASTGVGGTGDPLDDNDNYSIAVPPDLDNITITANSLGEATIKGGQLASATALPTDLGTVDNEAYLYFDNTGTNQNWTISNLNMVGFDGAIQMAQSPGGPLNAYDGTTITNNSITVPADIDTLTSGVDKDPSDNLGILLGFGTNQHITNNDIQLAGNGVSNTANFAQSVGIETQTGLPGSYDGLQITGNTITVQNAQSTKPEIVIGVWENGHADSSTISISGNSFTNLSSTNNQASNRERGFRLTSHSSASTTVKYQDNTVSGANIGFQWLNTSDFGPGDFSSGQAIQLKDNTISKAVTGILVQSSGAAYLDGNSITSSTTAVSVINGGRLVPVGGPEAVENNVFTGNTTGISIAATAGSIGPINNNNLSLNASGKALVNSLVGITVDAETNWWGSTSASVVAAQHTGLVDDGNFVTINPPVIASFTFPTLTVGTAITPITVTASGSPTPTLSASGLPNGLIFTDNGNGTGTISGTPAAGEGGAHGLATGNPVIIDAAIGFLSGNPLTVASFNINETPAFVNGGTDATAFTVGKAGNYQVLATGFPKPTFKLNNLTGTAVATGVAGVTFNTTTGLFAGTPTALPAVNPVTVTLTAINSAGSTTQTFTLAIYSTPAVNTFTVPTLTEGVAMTPITVGTTGLPTASLSATLPSGLVYVDNGNGTITISGTPDVGTAGSGKTITITATNAVGTGTRTSAAFSINGPPTFVNGSTDSTTFITTQSTSTFYQIQTTGFPVPTLALVAGSGSLPAGVTLNTSKQLIGKPTVAGVFTFTLRATNTAGSVDQVFTLTVNGPPTVNTFTVPTLTEGVTITPITVGSTGFPTPSLSATLPSGLGDVDNGDGTITISGTPDVGTAGSGKTITITATNGFGTASRTSAAFSINGPPTFVNGGTDSTSFTTTQSTSTFYQIPTTGFPIPTVALVVGSGSLPAGVTLNTSRQLIGKPTVSGIFTFTLRATNTAGSVDQVFTLTVNAPPTVNTFTVPTLTEGVAITPITVGSTGFPTPSLSATFPSGLGYVDNGDGTITISGTPDVGTAGSGKTITITATNAGGTGTRTSAAFSINGPPTFVNGSTDSTSFTTTQSTSTFYQIPTTGFPIPTVALVVGSGSLPAGVTLNTSRQLIGKPTVSGVFTFTLRATNTAGSVDQVFTLTVNAPPTVNTFTVPTLTEGVTITPITVGSTGFPTPSLSATFPLGLGYVDNGNGTITISGTPAAGTAGSGKTITITATNAGGTTSRTSAAFSINGPPTFVNGSTDAATITVGQSVGTTTGTNPTAPRVVVSGFPVPALKLNGLSGTSVATGVTGVTFNTTTGFFSGTPAANTAGVYTLTFTATATGQPTATQIFTLTVNPPSSTVGVIGYSQKVAANGTGTTWALTSGSLPGGLSLNTATGVISGNPSAAGTFNFTITATGSLGSLAEALSITINPPPSFITTTLPNATHNVTYSQALSALATGGTGTLTFTGTGLPSGLSISSGVLTGRIRNAGTYNFAITIKDSLGISSGPIAFTLVVV